LLDCLSLSRCGEPDLPGFTERYRSFIERHDDGFELYDLIAERLPGERSEFALTYQAPSVNSLAILAGTRDFFSRFLAMTTHSDQVRRYVGQTATLLSRLMGAATRYHQGDLTVSVDNLRRDLHLAQGREAQGMRLLKKEIGRTQVCDTSQRRRATATTDVR